MRHDGSIRVMDWRVKFLQSSMTGKSVCNVMYLKIGAISSRIGLPKHAKPKHVGAPTTDVVCTNYLCNWLSNCCERMNDGYTLWLQLR